MPTIKLTSYGTTEFSGNEIIHQKEMKKVEELLKKAVKDALEDNMEKSLKVPFYNTILVNGRRGAGKTSFLYSLKAKIEKDEKGAYQNACMLDFLDPTLIEEKAHIFLTIISLIKSKVDEKFESKYDDDSHLCCKKEWENSLEELAKGLPLINEKSKAIPDYWDDASHILNKGLKDMCASFNLRKNFNTFLDKSLKILGKKIFILFVDDVDTDFSKTVPLLETLRKYMCTPYIATIVSGDISLFSTAVRRRQWENFGKPLLINEYDKAYDSAECDKLRKNREKYQASVTELEAQYLQKIFRPENRIQLRNLKEINEYKNKESKKENDPIIIQLGEDEKNTSTKELEEFYTDVLKKYGIENAYQRATYFDFISEAPIRTQINFMQFFQHNAVMPDANRKLISLFSAELSQHFIDLYKIQEDNFLCASALKYLVSEHMLDEYYQLEPISTDTSTNACIFTLSLLFSAKVQKKPYLFFDYALRIAYMRNLLEEIGYRSENNKELTIEGLIKHCSAYSDIDFRQMVCYMTAYVQGLKNNAGDSILKIPALYRTSKKNKKSAFDGVIENSSLLEWQKNLAYLPLSVNLLGSNNTVNTYSMFTLLGSIADVIREKDIGNGTKEILIRLSQLRSYPTPKSISDGSVLQLNNTEAENSDDTVEFLSEKNEIWKNFESILDSWLKFIKGLNFSVSSYTVAKVITRCFYAFASIINGNKKKNLAEVMELLVYQLIHSALIEEYTESKADSDDFSIDSNNLALSVKGLWFNFEKLKNSLVCNDESGFPITKMLITCPFLLIYLDKNEKKIGNKNVPMFATIIEIVGKLLESVDEINELYNGEVYGALDKVSLSNVKKKNSKQNKNATEEK